MSHVVSIKTSIRCEASARAACRRLGLPEPTKGTVTLFSAEAHGLAIQLQGWIYPVVADLATGQLQFDNFQGRWGDPQRLDEFLQTYACEKIKIEARKRGHQCTEQTLADGSIKLTIQVNGGVS